MNEIIKTEDIQSHIFTIRGIQIMIDSDLANMYGVETKNLNLAVKRNIQRFPEKFRFKLSDEEWEFLRLQNETSKEKRGGRRYLPFAFTEQGVAMLSAVLRSETAIKGEIDHISHTNRIKELAKCYESPLPHIDVKLSEEEDKVNEYLIKMGFKL